MSNTYKQAIVKKIFDLETRKQNPDLWGKEDADRSEYLYAMAPDALADELAEVAHDNGWLDGAVVVSAGA